MCVDDCRDCKPCEKHRPRAIEDTLDDLILSQGLVPYLPRDWKDDPKEQGKHGTNSIWRIALLCAASKEIPPGIPEGLEQEHCTRESCIWMSYEYERMLQDNPSLHRHILPRKRKRAVSEVDNGTPEDRQSSKRVKSSTLKYYVNKPTSVTKGVTERTKLSPKSVRQSVSAAMVNERHVGNDVGTSATSNSKVPRLSEQTSDLHNNDLEAQSARSGSCLDLTFQPSASERTQTKESAVTQTDTAPNLEKPLSSSCILQSGLESKIEASIGHEYSFTAATSIDDAHAMYKLKNGVEVVIDRKEHQLLTRVSCLETNLMASRRVFKAIKQPTTYSRKIKEAARVRIFRLENKLEILKRELFEKRTKAEWHRSLADKPAFWRQKCELKVEQGLEQTRKKVLADYLIGPTITCA